MKKVKIIFSFMIILCCILFSGCGAHIDSKISLNTDGSGKREITCTIPDDNLNKMIGGESALDNLLKKNKPSILTMQKKKGDSSTIYTFTYTFKSFDDYLSQSESIMGSKPDSSFDISGETFHKKYSFQEENMNYKLMKWAVDAVSDSHLTYAGRNDLYEVGQTTVTMGDKSEKFNDKINFSDEKTYSIDKIAVYTKMNSNKTFSRSITYYFTDETFSALNGSDSGLDNFMKELIPYGGKLEKVNDSNNVKGYKISFSAADMKDLNSKTAEASKDKKPSFKITVLNNASVFMPRQQIQDSIDFSNYTSGAAIDKGISYSFEAPAGYTYETLMGSSISKKINSAELKNSKLSVVNFNNASQNISFAAAFHTINYSAYITAFLIIAAALIIVFIFIMIFLRKLKALDLSYTNENTIRRVTASKAVTKTLRDETTAVPEISTTLPGTVRCRICGSENKKGSNFCIYCGAPIIKLENFNIKNILHGINNKVHALLNKLKPVFSMENLKKWIAAGEYKDILTGAAVTFSISFAISFSLGSAFGNKLIYFMMNSIKDLPSGINKINSSISIKPWDIMYLSYIPTIRESISAISAGSSYIAAAAFRIPLLILLPIPVLSIWIGTRISTRKLDIKDVKARLRYSCLISLINSIALTIMSLFITRHFSVSSVKNIKAGINVSMSYSPFSVFAGSLSLGLIISVLISLRSYSALSGVHTSRTFIASSVNGIAKGLRNVFAAIFVLYIIAVICAPYLKSEIPGNIATALWKESSAIEYVIEAPNAICNTFVLSSADSYNIIKNINDSSWYIYLGIIFPVAAVAVGIYYTMLSEKRRLTPRDSIYFSAVYGIAASIIAYINGVSVKISAAGILAKNLGLKTSIYKMQLSSNAVLIFISSFILCFVISFAFDWVFDKVRS